MLIIYIDDLHHEKFGFKGDPIIKTPNIDALAKQGITFQNTFAVTAICITSRGNFMTGRYAARTGIYFDGFNKLTSEQAAMSYPYILNKAGYYTGYVGKWHLGPVPDGLFDSDHSFEGQGQFWSEDEKPGQGTHLTDRLGNQAVKMIKEPPMRSLLLSQWLLKPPMSRTDSILLSLIRLHPQLLYCMNWIIPS